MVTMTKPRRLEALIVAILTEARNQDRTKLLKTALMKFVYLADVYAAEEDAEHRTITRLPWRFVHYGPYAGEVDDVAGELETQRAIHVERRQLRAFENEENEGQYKLYMLPKGARAKSFKEIGVSKYVALRLSADIRRFGDNLPQLLDYVYFSTEPMREATPGAALDFRGCRPRRPEDFKHPDGQPLSKKRVQPVRDRLRELAAQRKQRNAEIEARLGPYDEVYEEGMAALSKLDAVEHVEGVAVIHSKGRYTDD